MTQEEIIEGNKLIAEFMGWWFDIGDKRKYIRILDEKNFEYLKSENDLLFNSSWDWLMSVVEKIEQEGHLVHIVKQNVMIKQNSMLSSPNIVNHSLNPISISKMEAVWFACIEFIKWYNQNKK